MARKLRVEYPGAIYHVMNRDDRLARIQWRRQPNAESALYSVNHDGCPYNGVWKRDGRGCWQEDGHTDKLHNYLDALAAFPE